jgi:hypothetical protein
VIIVLWLAVISLAVVMIGILRQVTSQLELIAAGQASPLANIGPAIGTKLPGFAGSDGSGNAVTDADLRGQPALLLFMASRCAPCRKLAEDMTATGLGQLASMLTIVTDPEGPDVLGLPAGPRIVFQTANEVSKALSIRATPFAVAVDESGIVRGKRGVNAVDALAILAASATSGRNGNGHRDQRRLLPLLPSKP